MQKYTNEDGRSMVEMLGVLAVIGVLSIGGIQGYTYAMNKYRANNVLNEINMASHQLATELVTSRNAQKMLSLGNPYDNGTMTTENYPFDYGCGNEGVAERACLQEELGYWISIGDLPEKICQNMLSGTSFFPYATATQLNGETVTDGTNCTEEDNEIMFLFNATETGGNTEGTTSDEGDDDTPTVNCPENTSVDGQGGLATILVDEKTGKPVNCYCNELDTKYAEDGTCQTLPEKCASTADCNRGDFCLEPPLPSRYGCRLPTEATGDCKSAHDYAISSKNDVDLSFVISTTTMPWNSGYGFCQALGLNMASTANLQCPTDTDCHSTENPSQRVPIVQDILNNFGPIPIWMNRKDSGRTGSMLHAGSGKVMFDSSLCTYSPYRVVCTKEFINCSCPEGSSENGPGEFLGIVTNIKGESVNCYCNSTDDLKIDGQCKTCRPGSSKNGLGALVQTLRSNSGTTLECYCNNTDELYADDQCMACPEGTSLSGLGGPAVTKPNLNYAQNVSCYCNNAYELYTDGKCVPQTCPEGTSEDGLGGWVTTLTNNRVTWPCHCDAEGTRYQDGTCVPFSDPGVCSSNADCNKGEYCDITDYGSDYCTTDTSGMTGKCRNANNDIKTLESHQHPPFIASNRTMTWWGAKHFCQALGKTLVEESNYDCYPTICLSGCRATTGYCHISSATLVGNSSLTNLSQPVSKMKSVYGNIYGWTNTSGSSLCVAYYVYTYDGEVGFGARYNKFNAVCK